MNKEQTHLRKGIEKRLEKLRSEINETNQKYQREITEIKAKLIEKSKNNLTKMQLATKARYRQNGER
jgi:Skp family chaperone for outer membrane proteins